MAHMDGETEQHDSANHENHVAHVDLEHRETQQDPAGDDGTQHDRIGASATEHTYQHHDAVEYVEVR